MHMVWLAIKLCRHFDRPYMASFVWSNSRSPQKGSNVQLLICKLYYFVIQERKAIFHLHVEFNEDDPEDIRGKYSHKIYGYLLPPHPGKELHVGHDICTNTS